MSLIPSSRRAANGPGDVGFGARITTRAWHRVATLTVRENLLMLVRHGRKSLLAADRTLDAGRGDALLVARGTQWDVVNDPAGQPRYEALVLGFGDDLVREFAARTPQPAAVAVTSACRLPLDEGLEEAVQRAASFLQTRAVSAAVRRHRLMEVLLLLAERGHVFAASETIGWDQRVRRLVAQQPGADWTVEVLADHFHTSASTLRRRLEGSGITLAALVREVRLETALSLLQTTRVPIGEIAQRCGWASHSRFSAAFQERWGFVPSVLRSGLTQNGQPLTQPG